MQGITTEAVRVLVADDSAVMRGIIRTLFAMHSEDRDSKLPEMQIVGEATDGVECLVMVRRLRPDVLLLDLEMPRMHGLGVLDELHAQDPDLPVIMCSAYTEAGARLTVEALARGASDYVMKPSEQSDFSSARRTLLEQLLPKIAALAARRGRGAEGTKGRERPRKPDGSKQAAMQEGKAARVDVVVIGVSTGGPLALEGMLPRLPADFPVPVLIVQHMPKLFTGALAERLDRCCRLRVKEAFDGAILEPGTVWLAPGDMHMKVATARRPNEAARRDVEGEASVEEVRIRLHNEEAVNYNRPSVDFLFHSAAKVYGAGALAAVLTGMGADGLAGSRSIHEAGGTVLAQDEATSVVWGMPGRVTQAGIAMATLPLMALGDELTRRAWMGRSRENSGTAKHSPGVTGAIRRGEAADGL